MPPNAFPDSSLPSLNAIIHSSINLARICLAMDVAFVTEIKNGRRIFRHVVGTEQFIPIQVGDSHPLEESYCQYVVNGEIPSIVDDSHIHPILKKLKATEAMSIRAHLGVPIRLSDGSVFGTFCCYSRRPVSTLRDVDVAAMAHFAALLADMLENRVYLQRKFESISERLTDAIRSDAIQVVYQPIFDLSTDGVVGFEALARFRCMPLRSPDQWFCEAHEVARGVELELLALKLALANLDKLPSHAYLAVNLSPHTIITGAVADCLAGVSLDRLVLEVTEHVPVEEYASLTVALAPLRTAGARLAIDDAGSGYASFRHILQLRPDIIKLDRSLIHEIQVDPGKRALASAIVSFAQQTGSRVVAEGVETKDELKVLYTLGVHAAQGYFLGHPAPAPGLPAALSTMND